MSVEIVHFPATRSGQALRAIIAATAAEREQVYRLRYDVYVTEMGLLPEDHAFVHDRSVRDPLDDRSILLLLLHGDEPVGTLRLTAARGGPLELEQYRSLADVSDPCSEICEATRYMIRRSMRGTLAGPALLLAVYRAMVGARLRVLLAAGKTGNLGQYYKGFGLTRLGQDTFTYDLVGSSRYELLRLDIGRPFGLARARTLAIIAALWLRLVFLGDLIARGRGFAPVRASGSIERTAAEAGL